MFKKPEDNEPRTKDFLLDAEQRKFIFAEDYCSTLSGLIPDITAKDCALIQERLEQKRRSRSKTPEVYNKEGPVLHFTNLILTHTILFLKNMYVYIHKLTLNSVIYDMISSTKHLIRSFFKPVHWEMSTRSTTTC